jgi:hypothetical protein
LRLDAPKVDEVIESLDTAKPLVDPDDPLAVVGARTLANEEGDTNG